MWNSDEKPGDDNFLLNLALASILLYWGPLPYAIGPVPSDRYSIIRLGALPGQNQPQ